MNESFGLAAFRSRTQVLRMENALHRAGLSAGRHRHAARNRGSAADYPFA